jgi:hypothetical protein
MGYLLSIGHAGVLYFLAFTGALLAANTYLLCYEMTGRKFSSLLAWVTTAFTVPVMHYSFEIYPEILGALLLVWSLRHIRQAGQTKPHIWLYIGVCAAFLPWLVTRFLVLSLILGPAALLVIALAQGTKRWRTLSVIGLCLPVVLSCAGLAAFDLRFYGEITPPLGHTGSGETIPRYVRSPDVEKALAAVAGSLFDQEAGQLIYSPIYALSPLGMLLLLKRRRSDGLLLLVPTASIYSGIAWIGFSPAWGIPYRYLVVILPLAGVALAYSLQRVTSPVFRGVGVVLFAISLTRTPLLLQEPLLAHTLDIQGDPSLSTAYTRLIPLAVRPYLPALREEFASSYAYSMVDGGIGEVVYDPKADGRCGWLPRMQMVVRAERGVDETGYILDTLWPESEQQARLLPARAYSACFRMKSEQSAPADSVVAIIDVSTEGGILAHKEVARRDLPDSGYGPSCVSFDYPGAERLRCRVLFTGQSDLCVSCLTISYADNARWWVLAGIWLAALAVFTAYYYLRYRNVGQLPVQTSRSRETEDANKKPDSIFPLAAGLIIALTIAVVLGSHLYLVFTPRVFEAEDLPHIIGQTVTDHEASGGKAVHASKDMETNALVYGPYEFFQPGEYGVRFRMKAGAASADVEVASVDVYGTASGTLVARTIEAREFEEDARYEYFRLSFSNPASQALQFRVLFLGNTDLWVDKITVEREFAGQR